MKPTLVILLHSHTPDRVHQAASLCLAASSMGWPCHLFLFYQALADFVKGAWDAAPGGSTNEGSAAAWSEEAGLPAAADLLAKARGEEGGLKLYACSASARVLGLDPIAVRQRVDEIVGLPTVLSIAESARFAWYV